MRLAGLVLVGLLWAVQSQATVLSDAALALAPGQMVQLSQASGIGAAIGATGSSGHTVTYGQTIPWSGINRALYLCAQDHGGGAQRCVKYDEVTHAWTILQTPPWGASFMHGYDHNTIDVIGNYLYHVPVSTTSIYRCNLTTTPNCATADWSVAFTDSRLANGIGLQSSQFINWKGKAGSYLVAAKLDGTNSFVDAWDVSTATLTTSLVTYPYNGSAYGTDFVECTESLPYLCYIANDSNEFYTMDINYTRSTLRATPPCTFHWNESDSIVDPVTGRLLTLCGSGTTGLHEYNPTTNTWSVKLSGLQPPQTFAPQAPTANNGIVMASIPRYGVILIIAAQANAGSQPDPNTAVRMYLYKNAQADFTGRCAQSGVLNCQGFDTAAVFSQAVNTAAKTDGLTTGTNPNNIRDTTNKTSGASSMKFHIPVNAGQNCCDAWWGFFGQGGSNVGFSQNSTFYVQYGFRADAVWTSLNWVTDSYPKLVIFHHQSSSCANEEITTINRNTKNVLTMYTECGARGVYTAATDGIYNEGGAQINGQSGFSKGGYECEYNGSAWNGPTCFNMVANQWYSILYKVTIGTWSVANSTIEAWVAPYGMPYRKWVNVGQMILASNTPSDVGYNVLELTQFMTAHSGSNPAADVWYDDLLISTALPYQPVIGDSAAADTTPPLAPTGVSVTQLMGGY